jgi:hypothetical protein
MSSEMIVLLWMGEEKLPKILIEKKTTLKKNTIRMSY